MASQSVLELAVNTGKWDSGLKKAKSALDNFTTASGGLQQALGKDSDKMQKFVQMMGSMESKAKTAKGQMSDYKGTIEQLTLQYNRMTEAQQKTIGQDYLRTIDQLRQKYQAVSQEVQQMNRSLQQTPSTPKGGGFLSGLGDKMGGALQVFAGNMMTKAAGAIASLGSEMYGMVQQGIELAKAGEGIRIAFERLGRGDILDGLRQATHGTVTDIELMKAAVKFNDFKLPLDELGTMLAFAQQKAKDTGQSVDYMVDSIVTGLGRKSLMILDNLGLSAAEIKNKMAETGDMTKAVGEIIREQMAKAGDYVETAADRAAQANVSLQNKMEELGRKFAPVEEASNQLWTSMKIGILDIIGGPLATMLNQLTEAGRLKNALNDLNGVDGSGNTKVDQQLSALRGSNFKSVKYGSQLAQYDKQISTYQTMIDNGGKLPGAPAGSGKDVRWLQSQLDALKVMRSEYVQGAKQILSPIKPVIDTSKAVSTSKTKAARGETPEEKAAKIVATAERTYAETLTKNSIRLEAGLQSTVESKKKELAAQERLFEAYSDAYTTYSDPKYKEAIENIVQKIKGLGGEIRNIELAAKIKPYTFSDKIHRSVLSENEETKSHLNDKNFISDSMKDLDEKVLTTIAERQAAAAKNVEESWRKAGSAVGTFGNILGSIKDPAAQTAAIVAQAIASIALAYADTLAKDKTTKWNIWAFIAASAAAMVSMGTAIASIHSSTGYERGGVIPGNAYSGDNQWIRVNAGETVLTRAQAGVLANALQDNTGGLVLESAVRGDDLRLILRRGNLKRGYNAKTLSL